MRIIFFLLIVCLLGTACSKKRLCGCVPPPRPENLLKATVVQTSDLDCGKPVISFDVSDTAAVFQITGGRHLNYFLVKQLPPAMNVVGQKLSVIIEKLRAEDEFTCTTMGPVYDHINLLYAEKRD